MIKKFGDPSVFEMGEEHGDILAKITEVVNLGKLKPLVNPHEYTLDQISDAHRLLESKMARGKIVLTIN